MSKKIEHTFAIYFAIFLVVFLVFALVIDIYAYFRVENAHLND